MGKRCQEKVFYRAWNEQQHLRLLLDEIEVVIKQIVKERGESVCFASCVIPKPLRQKLSDFGEELCKSFAIEGANGDVAITLACDRRLDAEVA